MRSVTITRPPRLGAGSCAATGPEDVIMTVAIISQVVIAFRYLLIDLLLRFKGSSPPRDGPLLDEHARHHDYLCRISLCCACFGSGLREPRAQR